MTHKIKVAGIFQIGSLLLDHGIAPAQVLQNLDLPPTLLLDPEAWIDRELSFRIVDEAGRATADRFAGLHVMEVSKFEQYAEWGCGILRARNVQDALVFAAHHVRQMCSGIRVGIDRTEDEAHVWVTYDGDLGADPLQHVEANLLILKKILDLAVEPVMPAVHVPNHKPEHTDEMERLLGPRLVFDTDRAELVFDQDVLRLPLRDITITPIAEAYSPPTTPRETAGAVMRVLRDLIKYERPTASAIADSLDMNLRTMQRHLAVWGVTFEEMLAAYRWRRAEDYLAEGRYTVTEIAFHLGYSDAAHFTRAFRRWTGQCPREARSGLRLSRLQPGPMTVALLARNIHGISLAAPA